MRKLIPLKFFSSLLLLVMLTVTLHCVHDSAHAEQSDAAVTGERLSPAEVAADHQSPCPHEQHKDYDGCDSCINCSCHAPFIIQPLQLRYSPIISSLGTSAIFKHLPEVFLSKFIPPQNLA